jgi:putative NIF3 family GTP cyclohydrolase 1 type 2
VNAVVKAMIAAHPYEEAAYDIYAVEQKGKTEGIGRIGELPEAVPFKEFAAMLKEKLGLDAIRLVGDPDKMVKKVGLCTGAGVSFVSLAAAKGCDAYLTGDIKYHEAQDAIEKGVGVVDVTHYASEVLIVPVLQKKLTEAAKENGWDIEVVISKVNGQTFWNL